MENSPYSPFPNTSTNKEPYKPSHHPHFPSSSSSSSFSSSSSIFPYHHLPSFPSPYLPTAAMPITAHPPPSGPPIDPVLDVPAVQYPMPYPGQMQPALSFSGVPLSRPNYINFGTSNGLLGSDQERRAASDAWITKVARTKRKIARQKSLGMDTSSSSMELSAMFPYLYYEGVDASTVLSMHEAMESSAYSPPVDPYDFVTPDNKKLKLILKKELKNSDVGSLGRIVIPKRDAEQNLPTLTAKEGIQMVIRDINSDQEWSLRYKFWTNNKSRMYVLENTGDFVKKNGLGIGDTIILYEDRSYNLYFSIKKAEKPLHELLQKPHRNTNSHWSSFQVFQATQAHEEEDAALALLIEQLRHREHQDVTLPLMDYPSSSSSQYAAPAAEPQPFNYFIEQGNNNNSSNNRDNNPETQPDDFYSSVDSLNGINSCTFPFLDQWSGSSGENQ